MRFFIRHQPENLTLVVLSRNLPQLGIANLRVRDQLLEIGSQQLAFTHQEAKQFFDCRLSSPIEAAESSRICDDVSGWATALQLIALSARQNTHSAHKSARRLAGINASHLSDYLVDEVLDNVDLATRHFLLKSAILRSMNDALITRVTGEENGQMRLEEIERQGLFLQRMDDTGEWFCYHHCLVTSCASAASGNWRRSCRKSTVPPQKAGWPVDFPAKRFIMRWRQAMR